LKKGRAKVQAAVIKYSGQTGLFHEGEDGKMNAARLLVLLLALGYQNEPSMWTVQTSGIDTNLRGMSAVHGRDAIGKAADVVWVSGSNGVILKSVDSGKNWKRLHVAGGDALDFRGIRAFDAQIAYAMSIGSGENSRIYKTTDGGENWTLQFSDKREAFFLDDIVCASEKECFAVSDPVDGKLLVVSTSDGVHWKELPRDKMPAALTGEGVFAASGSTLAIYGGKELYIATGGPAARVFHSPDLGVTWTVTETPLISGDASYGIFSIVRERDTVAVVGGDYKDLNRADRVAAYSLDNGVTWKLAAQQPGGFRSGVASIGGATLVAVGPSGEDVSRDAGVHWAHTDSLNLNAVVVLDDGNAWAAGPKGTVARLNRHEK
jgi:photosystem II stability/assembly factor-like uncharacterized protein